MAKHWLQGGKEALKIISTLNTIVDASKTEDAFFENETGKSCDFQKFVFLF